MSKPASIDNQQGILANQERLAEILAKADQILGTQATIAGHQKMLLARK